MVETATFGPNAGNLRMLTYHPPGLPDGAPLVVTLHGCGQEAEAYAEAGWLALADRLGFATLAAVRSG
jgi:feruloyl esterase